ncbi:ORC-CDC6 family AAA ATPase [Microbacterium aurantiacum]|uniref:ORC-CDC6 family AAA ATPase n=1 Tax=Microbacterium aurantiacum TaxID=162393 RepID=UPI003D70E094
MTDAQDLTRAVAETIGILRAENYESKALFDVVERPDYWSQLEGRRACFLVGGRGTGKTTALRSLAFEGQSQLSGYDIVDWPAVGFYWRIETSVVAAFNGSRIAEDDWARLFGHYVNLRLLLAVLEFVRWFEQTQEHSLTVDGSDLALASASLSAPAATDLSEFASMVRLELARFEAGLNQLRSEVDGLTLSMLGKPVEHLLNALTEDPRLADQYFVFALDEYENLMPYQQRVINTLIKHAGDGRYTFKVGVKRGGIRDRSTLHPQEFLSAPADYIAIQVEDELRRQGFSDFALRICDDRLQQIAGSDASVADLFPDLSMDDEAALLGGKRRRAELRAELKASGAAPSDLAQFDEMTLLAACMVGYWADAQRLPTPSVLAEAVAKPDRWANRVNNYGYAMLFTIRASAGIKKFYAGWSVISHLSEGNIRSLLNTVNEALVRHIEAGNTLSQPISPQVQTSASEAVGQRAVFELAGLHVRGTELLRLVLSLGRIFGVLAAFPHGHTPEVTQFRVDWQESSDADSLRELLEAGVMHDALISFPGDKNSARSGQPKEHDYQLHPLFAPFFAYSYRRKRRITLGATDLLRLSTVNPQGTISKVLRRNARNPGSALPEQLELLGDFFIDVD